MSRSAAAMWTICGSRKPLARRNCRPSSRDRASAGAGSVKLSCTIPSPSVSPYGRISGTRGLREHRLPEVEERVGVRRPPLGDALEPAPAVPRPRRVRKPPSLDRLEHPRPPRLAEQADRLAQHRLPPLFEGSARHSLQRLAQRPCGLEHPPRVLDREHAI